MFDIPFSAYASKHLPCSKAILLIVIGGKGLVVATKAGIGPHQSRNYYATR
jgi:hypothetical protein